MGLSYRVGSAALLLIAIFLIIRHLNQVQDGTRVQPFWQVNWPEAAHVPEQPPAPESPAKQEVPAENVKDNKPPENKPQGGEAGGGAGTGGTVQKPPARPGRDRPKTRPATVGSGHRKVFEKKPVYETTPIIVPNDRTLVMAKLSWEDTSWVSNDLNEWRNAIYTVDNPYASRHTPINKGRESLAYLQYIVEHYHNLPSTIVFLHSHKDGWPQAWHTDTLSYSNVESVRNLKTDFVQKNGYVNLRCQETPGCPDEIQPFRSPAKPGKSAEKVYAQAWQELFNSTQVPEVVAAPCCSQFAVSRNQVLKRPRSDYEWFYNWVLMTPLSDELTSNVMEYTWHIIFGKNPVYCPDSFQCYQDVYGSAYFW